jgi:2-oxoglutarate ferredoxin oxidoreductase subunit gamma
VEASVLFAGFGGQGLLFAGRILAGAAIKDGLEVFWIPSYGPEMRGGTAACTVIVADEAIGSPIVDEYDAVVAMNLPSLRKYGAKVRPGGLLIVNASLIAHHPGRHDLHELRLPCTALAAEGGDDKLVSVVGLGALVGRLRLVTRESVCAAMEEASGGKRPAILAADLGAFAAGLEAGRAGGRRGSPDTLASPFHSPTSRRGATPNLRTRQALS